MNPRRFKSNWMIMTSAERNGAFVLVVLIAIVLAIRFIAPMFINNDQDYIDEFEKKIAKLEQEEKSSKSRKFDYSSKSTKNTYSEKKVKNQYDNSSEPVNVTLFNFDPNTVSLNELKQLGFAENVANRLINYREKGGAFRLKSDLLKIYGLDSLDYKRVENYITIVKDTVIYKKAFVPKVAESSKQERLLIEVNSADSATWTTLPGIGPVFAKRICAFRNYLGGFVQIDQIKEVYKLTPETYDKIVGYLEIDTTRIVKIDINFSDVNELKKHPYIKFETAKKIVDHRTKKGSYQSVYQLIADSVLLKEDYNKLEPYLCVK